MLSVLIRIANIKSHDKIRKKSLNICFLQYWKNFVGTEKRVRIIQGKRAIRIRAIEVILYIARSAKCSTKPLSQILTTILTAVKERLRNTAYARSGVSQMWILKNSKVLLQNLQA